MIQEKLIENKWTDKVYICTKHLIIGNNPCYKCLEGKRKAIGGFVKNEKGEKKIKKARKIKSKKTKILPI